MFTIYHLIWVLICILVVTTARLYIRKHNVSLQQILPICCKLCICSEVVKTFSVIKMVPSSDGSLMYPYLELHHLPLHLCSMLIFVIFFCTYSQNQKWKTIAFGLLYPASILGGISAISLPSIFTSSVPVTQAFTHPLAYQFFLYHAMLIVLGLSIVKDPSTQVTSKNYGTTMKILLLLGFGALYTNAMFAYPTYENGVLKSVEYGPNLLFVWETPIGVKLHNLTEWYIYLAILISVAFLLVAVVYIPIFKRDRTTIK